MSLRNSRSSSLEQYVILLHTQVKPDLYLEFWSEAVPDHPELSYDS